MVMPSSTQLACALHDIRNLLVYLGCLVEGGYVVVLKECYIGECRNGACICVPIVVSSEARESLHIPSLNSGSVLAQRIPGTGEPGGLPSMGSHRVRHD